MDWKWDLDRVRRTSRQVVAVDYKFPDGSGRDQVWFRRGVRPPDEAEKDQWKERILLLS